MPQILCGSAIDILKTLPENSIDVVYTAPSPFAYYKDSPEKIGGEERLVDYIDSLISLCRACRPVLKKSGSLFIQVADLFTPNGDLAGIPSTFEHFMRMNSWYLNDRILWHRTETLNLSGYSERGFLKNYEFIFHFVMDNRFYFNEKSKYARSSVVSYPIEDTYFTNEFDSGLPSKLTEIIIDTSCPKNGVIMDPLAGTGKVGVVAKKMGRDFIGIEIDKETAELCKIRLGL